jgi:hypothetical protein
MLQFVNGLIVDRGGNRSDAAAHRPPAERLFRTQINRMRKMKPTIRPSFTSPSIATGLIIARDVSPLKINA